MAQNRKLSKKRAKATVQEIVVSKLLSLWRWLDRKQLTMLVFYWLIVWLVLVAFFFSEALKSSNYLEVFPEDLIFPLLMQAATAIIIAFVVWLLPRPKTSGAKSITALFLASCMVNYDDRLMGVVGIFRSLLPVLPKPDNDLPVISSLFLLVLLVVGICIGRLVENALTKHPSVTNQNVLGAVAVIVGFMFFNQAIPIYKIFKQVVPESSHQATAQLDEAASMKPDKNAYKPDIYYIVLEDYTSNSILKSQFGYDNSSFLDYLRGQGFSVDESATSQYPFTAGSVASTMNMSYNNNAYQNYKNNGIQSRTLFFNMIRQAQAIKLLKQEGYVYYQLGNSYGAMNKAPLANLDYSWDYKLTIFGQNKRLRGLEVSNLLESPYYRFAKIPAKHWPLQISEIGQASFIRNQFVNLDAFASAKQQGGRFIFANILAPHWPAYFNADCSLSTNPYEDSVGTNVKQKYIGSIQCIDSQIQQVIGDINKNSGGKAVILLISDEGQHPNINQSFLKPILVGGDNNDGLDTSPISWSISDLAMKYGVLQAVHIPNATAGDIQNFAPVNTFRIVLNRYFGYSFGYLPKCQLIFSEGSNQSYEYADITERLTGIKTTVCKQYE